MERSLLIVQALKQHLEKRSIRATLKGRAMERSVPLFQLDRRFHRQKNIIEPDTLLSSWTLPHESSLALIEKLPENDGTFPIAQSSWIRIACCCNVSSPHHCGLAAFGYTTWCLYANSVLCHPFEVWRPTDEKTDVDHD